MKRQPLHVRPPCIAPSLPRTPHSSTHSTAKPGPAQSTAGPRMPGRMAVRVSLFPVCASNCTAESPLGSPPTGCSSRTGVQLTGEHLFLPSGGRSTSTVSGTVANACRWPHGLSSAVSRCSRLPWSGARRLVDRLLGRSRGHFLPEMPSYQSWQGHSPGGRVKPRCTTQSALRETPMYNYM